MSNLVIAAAAVASTLTLAPPLAAQSLAEAWRLGGFDAPESAYWHRHSNRIIVSQLGAFGLEAGADGKLSLLSPEGELIAADWVKGLTDPKGMASHGGLLYVADVNKLHVIDIASSVRIKAIPIPGAMMLNDVTVTEDGTVYASDMIAGAIHRLRDGSVDQLVAAGGVPLANAVFAHKGAILVGSFGDETAGQTSAMTNPGRLLSVDPASGEVSSVAGARVTASVDGITVLGDWLIYDNNSSGRIVGFKDGAATILGETASGAADLGATPELLLVPNINSGEVTAYRVK